MAIPAILSAQTTVFSENFEMTTDLAGAGWTMYNDTNTPFGTYGALFGTNAWIIANWTAESGNIAASTVSWFTTVTAADRWLVTPSIVIPAGVATASLTFKARSHDDSPWNDGFSLKISETNNTKAAFTTQLLTVASAENLPLISTTPYTIDLSAYKGKTIYLSWVDNFTNGNLLSIDDILVTTTAAMGTDDVNASKSNILIYPNPTKESFKLQFKNESSAKGLKISIADASGKTVKQFTGSQESYDISALDKGVYFVTVENGDVKETKKLIKK